MVSVFVETISPKIHFIYELNNLINTNYYKLLMLNSQLRDDFLENFLEK